MKKLKLKSSEVSNAKKKLKDLIEKILRDHPRSKPTYLGKRTLTEQTGNLFREINPDFRFENNKLVMEVKMMDYYKYLDEGTDRIEPWFFSEEIMDSEELLKITEDLVEGALEGRLVDMISNINKK